MRVRMPHVAPVLVLAIVLAACSGADPATSGPATSDADDGGAAATTPADPTDAADGAAGDTATTEAAAAPPAAPADPAADPADPAEELPQFASDFSRVCTTEVGFGGAATYEQVAGTHPVVLFEEVESGTLITTAKTLPAGWAVEEDADFEDNSELAATELVACATVAQRTPNGTTCELDGDEGTITLELVDATFEMAVHAATTGALLGTETIEAASTECPTFVFVSEGQTEYLNSPTEDQLINALQPYVSP